MVTVTLRIHHGGSFKKSSNNGVLYLGGEIKTFEEDLDEFCGFWFKELGKQCGGYDNVKQMMFLIPRTGFSEGLRTVFDDKEVRAMTEIAKTNRCIDLFVVHGDDETPDCVNDECGGKDAYFIGNSRPPSKIIPPKLLAKRAPQVPSRTSPRCKGNESPKNQVALTQQTSLNVGSIDNACDFTTKLNPSKFNSLNPTPSLCTSSVQTPTPTNTQVTPVPQKQTSQSNFIRSVVPKDYQWEDTEAELGVTFCQILNNHFKGDISNGSNLEYDAEIDEFGEGYDSKTSLGSYGDKGLDEGELSDVRLDEEEHIVENDGLEEEYIEDVDTSDDEAKIARERVKGYNQQIIELRKKLQRDAGEGKLGLQKNTQLAELTSHIQEVEGGPTSEYEEIHTPPSSGEDETLSERRARRVSIVGENTDWSTFKWESGQRFPNRYLFKKAVAKYAIIQGRNLSIGVSDKGRQQRLGVKCIGDCPFKLYASWDSRKATFVVKRVKGEHTCCRNMNKNKQLKAPWVAEQLVEVFKVKPHWPAKEIIEAIRLAYKVMVKSDFAYKVKWHAHKLLYGSMKDHYMKVGKYLEALKKASPGSTLKLLSYQSSKRKVPVFQRLFVSFEGIKKGWMEGCRKIICIDAFFLKTFLGGQLMSAVGRDGNDQMFPLAWAAVVEGENNSSWIWFLKHVQNALELKDRADLTIVSDEHQSILTAVATIFPEAEHKHCARHIFSHWHKTWKGDDFKYQFWKTVKSYNMPDYEDALDDLNKMDEDAVTDFKAYDPRIFCRGYLKTNTHSDVITNNMAETFNAYIIHARSKHIIDMLEDIRVSLMQRLVLKKKELEKWKTKICPRIQLKLDKEKELAFKCYVLPSTNNLFQVNHFTESLIVDLEAKTCSCRKWEMTGVPCLHACAVVFFCHRNPVDFVGPLYTKATYQKVYNGSIPPLDGERYWPRVNVPLDPPPIKVGPGKPRKKRIKDPYECPKKSGKLSKHGMEMTCTICKRKGHNKRRCPNKDSVSASEPQPKRPKGRPRKDGNPTQPKNGVALDGLHSVTAQPTLIGINGRTSAKGRGSRGGGRTTSTGRGREGRTNSAGNGRGRSNIPRGVGVLFGYDGTTYTNLHGRPTPITQMATVIETSFSQPSTQGSSSGVVP